MIKSARDLCATGAHKVLWAVLVALVGGVAMALGSKLGGSQIMVVVGLAILIIVVILCCLLDLRFEYELPENAKWNNIGFRQCKFLCWDKFTWAIFVSWAIITMLAGFLCLSGGLAMYIRYGTYIRDEFWGFLVEVTLMSVMTAVPIVLISWNRGGHALELMLEVGVISGKFGGLHILLELCGFYAHTFSEEGEPLQRLSITGAGLYSMNASQLSHLVDEQVAMRLSEGTGHENTFLKMLVVVFVITFGLILVVLLKERFRRQDEADGRELTEKELRKLHAKRELGVRMNVMLVLSVILGGLMMIVLILGLRTDEDSETNETVAQVAEAWSLVGQAGIVAALACSVVGVCAVAINTRFAGYINVAPWTFIAELCIVVLLSITPLGYVSYNRGHEHTDIAIELGILTLKFGGLHLLLELSGFYATAMGGRYRKDAIMNIRRVGDPVPRGSTEMSHAHVEQAKPAVENFLTRSEDEQPQRDDA